MHGHNLERRGPWIADHAQDTILSLSSILRSRIRMAACSVSSYFTIQAAIVGGLIGWE